MQFVSDSEKFRRVSAPFGSDIESLMQKLPDVRTLLRDPEGTPLSLEPAILFAVSSAVAATATTEDANAVARLARRLEDAAGGEWAVLVVQGFLSCHPELKTSEWYTRLCESSLGALLRP